MSDIIVQRLFDAFKRPETDQGGIARLAELLRSPATTVSSWKKSGIPQWRKHSILRIAYGHKVSLPQDVIDHLDPGKEISAPRGYPVAPGYQDADTSREAAELMNGTAPLLRERVLAAITAAGGLTVHEGAATLNLPVSSVQPRFSELVALKAIRDSGERRRNESSGRRAVVWTLAPQE